MSAVLSLQQAVHDVVMSGLQSDRLTISEAVDRVQQEYPDLVANEAEGLIRQRLKDVVRRVMREMSDDDQPALPNLRLPVAIVVRQASGEIYYVSSTRATWSELLAGYRERETNSRRVIGKLDTYATVIDRLRPFMERHPKRSVADALRLEKKANG